MSTDNRFQPESCPCCQSSMVLRQVDACSKDGQPTSYYFLDCSQCGFGAGKAFSTVGGAIIYWNELVAQTDHPFVSELNKSPADELMTA